MDDLYPELWDLSVNENGHLEVGNVDAVDLAAEYGTPVYIVHEKRLREVTLSQCRFDEVWHRMNRSGEA